MRLFPLEPVIGEREGFTPEKDIFVRKPIGDGLTNLVSTIQDPIVIALDAQWGAGKTTFLKMWAGELRKLGFPVIYFDAFQNDFAEDAFVALAGEIVQLVDELHKAATPAAKVFTQKALGAGKVLLRSGLRLGVKLATLNVFDTKDLEDAVQDVAEELSDLEDKYVGETLTRQKDQKAAFAAFRDALGALPALLAEDAAEGATSRPLVLIVDELDRCRPVFALELLERMKHFFSVPNVHFVLGANLDQLENSVVAAYGSGIKARIYLEKFIHLTVTFPHYTRSEREKIVPRYVKYLMESLLSRAPDPQFIMSTMGLVGHVAERRGLSLRTVERIVSTVALVSAFTSDNYFRPPAIVGGLAVIRHIDPALYAAARNGTASYVDVATALRLDVDPDSGSHVVESAQLMWRYCLDPGMSESEVRQVSQELSRYNIGARSTIVPLIINEVIERLKLTTV
jgi:hypothetical protein